MTDKMHDAMAGDLPSLHSEVVEYLWTELFDGDADMPEGADAMRDAIADELWRDVLADCESWRKLYAASLLIKLLRLDELPFKDGRDD